MKSDRARDSSHDAAVYSGVDNLEVMAEARRYTAFLCDLIGRPAGKRRGRPSLISVPVQACSPIYGARGPRN